MNEKTKIKNEILNKIENASNIAICAHRNPDFDCISSALIFYFFIKENYKKSATIFVEDDVDGLEFYSTLPGFDKVNFVDDLAKSISAYDLLIFVDSNVYKQFTSDPLALENILKSKENILVDHHDGEGDRFNTKFAFPESPSCAGVFTDFLFDENSANFEMAFWSVVGIMSDTSKLSYVDSTQIFEVEKLTRLVKQFLIDLRLVNRILDYRTRFDVLQEQELFKNLSVRFSEKLNCNFICSFLSEDFYKIDAGKKGLAESTFINFYLYNIANCEWGFVVKMKDSKNFKISFRSSGRGPNVRLWTELFGGGGHNQAAGASIKFDKNTKPLEVIDYVIQKIENSSIK
ncbi:MAG: MGPA protein [Candidatus Dojkabacteria bacterium]|nr:MAG: MGPA protein [Candidatus Dojkabacteria bacterium]